LNIPTISADWYNNDFSYKKEITISNKIDDYQTFLNISKTSGIYNCSGHCNDDFSDLRFVNSSETGELPYWIEYYVSGSYAWVWVNNKYNESTIYMYYGNSGASTTSDGDDTFIFYDDFTNLDKWSTGSAGGKLSVTGNDLKIATSASHNTWNYITKDLGTAYNARLLTRIKTITYGNLQSHQCVIASSSLGSWSDHPNNHVSIRNVYSGSNIALVSNRDNAGVHSEYTKTSASASVWYRGFVEYGRNATLYDANYNILGYTTAAAGTYNPLRYIYFQVRPKSDCGAGETYYDFIAVMLHTSGTEPSYGFGSEQEQGAGATVPTVATNDATGVEETNATIHGTLTDNGSADTTCYFILNTTNDFGVPIFNVTKGVVADAASFYNDTAPMTTLTPGTTYFFNTQANNSEGWDVGSITTFLTKPNEPTGASCSAGEGWINVSWTGATGADRYHVRYKSGSSPTSITDGTLFGNVTILYINKSIGAGTHYFSIWSYTFEDPAGGPARSQYSDAYDTTSGTETAAPTWHSSSFGGSVTVESTAWSNTAPTVECNSTGSFPANQSTDISLQPTIAANVNDTDGNQSTVWFYNSTDGSTWTLQQTNTTVLNETVTYQYTEASSYNTKYYWKVSANDTHDNTSASFEFTTEDLTPDAPASLSAVADSQTQITITWTDQTGADSTRVEQSTNADESWEPNEHDFVYNGSAETATNSSLSCGTPYYYKAWSYNTSQGVWGTPAWDNDTTTDNCPTWHSESFGGSVTVSESSITVTYIDDNADAGWYNETQVHTVQEGIDNITSTGTVYIWDGSYSENVIVNKTVSIIGNGSSVVTVDSGETLSAFNVTSDYVNISGVKATNSGSVLYADAGIFINANYTNVSNCNCSSNNGDGIIVGDDYGLHNNIEIYNCTIYSNADDGIMLQQANHCTIINNTIRSNSDDAIYFVFALSHNNTAYNNNCTDNNHSVYLDYAKDNMIYNNYFGNTSLADHDGGNTWNTTKVLGTNIIGGSYLGGNYWSDYTGYDSDADGLGDTDLPHNCSELIQIGGDYHPLTTFTSYIDVSIENNSWDGGSPSAGSSFRTNCTFHQNGSVNLDVVIVINSTNSNYTLINYTDYDSQDEYCGNFTIDAWSSETAINISTWPPNTYILQDFATGSHLLGFRIWVPTSFSTDKREDFEVILVATEHT